MTRHSYHNWKINLVAQCVLVSEEFLFNLITTCLVHHIIYANTYFKAQKALNACRLAADPAVIQLCRFRWRFREKGVSFRLTHSSRLFLHLFILTSYDASEGNENTPLGNEKHTDSVTSSDLLSIS